MRAALVTNTGPGANDRSFRLNGFAANLAREAPPEAASISLFAPDSSSFVAQPSGPFREVLPLPEPSRVEAVFRRGAFDTILLDYDATVGSQRDRETFLRLACDVVEAARESRTFVLASDSNVCAETARFHLFPAKDCNLFQQLLTRGGACAAFSEAVAGRLAGKTPCEFTLIPAGSAIPPPVHTRAEARALLGFPESRKDLLMGVLGRYAEFNLDWFNAACYEAFRCPLPVSLLYLGPDGSLFRNHRMPISFLDAGVLSPEEISLRLRAMDLAILPTVRPSGRPDCLALNACLQHGVPVIATASPSGLEAQFGAPPGRLVLVPDENLGAYIEAVEFACQQIAAQDGAARALDSSLASYFQSHLSSQVALQKLFAKKA